MSVKFLFYFHPLFFMSSLLLHIVLSRTRNFKKVPSFLKIADLPFFNYSSNARILRDLDLQLDCDYGGH